MLAYLRYALATFCFAASVGCLALWSGWTQRVKMGGIPSLERLPAQAIWEMSA